MPATPMLLLGNQIAARLMPSMQLLENPTVE
jgi:hypothetical protein